MADLEEHEVIWLHPTCRECINHERAWCQDNVWEDGCDVCGRKPVKYVLAHQTAPSEGPSS